MGIILTHLGNNIDTLSEVVVKEEPSELFINDSNTNMEDTIEIKAAEEETIISDILDSPEDSNNYSENKVLHKSLGTIELCSDRDSDIDSDTI